MANLQAAPAVRRCWFGIFAAIVSINTFSQTDDGRLLQTPWFKEYQKELLTAWVPPSVVTQGKVRFVIGNDIVRHGRQFRNGNNWLALACTPEECSLNPAELEVTDEPAKMPRTGKHDPSQRLHFQSLQSANKRVVAWLEAGRKQSRLTAGTIPTYFSGEQRPKDTRLGTEEAQIALPGGSQATLMPILIRAPSTEEEHPPILLLLRENEKRQLLLGQLGQCRYAFDSSQYLLWVGDLDRDGRADYLVSFVDASGPIHLYLSSEAKAGRLVGLAGTYNTPATTEACGGGNKDDEP